MLTGTRLVIAGLIFAACTGCDAHADTSSEGPSDKQDAAETIDKWFESTGAKLQIASLGDPMIIHYGFVPTKDLTERRKTELLRVLLALGCAACFAPAEETPANALYEPFLVEPAVTPSSPTNVTLAYFDVDFDSRTAPTIYLATAGSSTYSQAAVIEKMFGNFLISSSVGQYGPFDLDSRPYPLVSWSAMSGALWNEDQVLDLLKEQDYFAREAHEVQSGLGFGYITKTVKSFDYLHSILSSRLVSEKVSDTCYFYRYEPADAQRVLTGFAVRDEDGILDLYDGETVECVGQFLAKSMGLTVSQAEILALTGFDEQTDRGSPQPPADAVGEAGGAAAERDSKPRPRSSYPTVEVQPDQEHLQRIAEGGCILASIVQKPASRSEARLAHNGCPTAPSAAAIAYPYYVYGMGSGENESSAERISNISEICRKNIVGDFVAEDFCKY